MNLTEENIIGVKELNENENISLSDFVPVQKENETEIKKISLEKILLAVSKMTDEQKKVLNSALALIDDENISNEKTFSSEKINSQIETVTTSKVAEIVANAPEDFNTLKEMSDWIAEHQEDATAMNTAILKNTTDIESLQNEIISNQTLKVIPDLCLRDNRSINLQLETGKTYLFINSHVMNIGEVLMFAWLQGYPIKVKRISSGYQNVSYSCTNDGLMTITDSSGGCRGYVYELNQTSV